MTTSTRGDIAGTHWNPERYARFGDHRLRPALELLARVDLESPASIVDLGCGTGNVTRIIAERWPSAAVSGLDSSPEMLAKARSVPSAIEWIEGRVESWEPAAPVDLVFSNATLHWVEGHRELFPRLVRFLRPGGVLAVQMPLSFGAPSHRLMRETLATGGVDGQPLGSTELRGAMDRDWVESPQTYYDVLVPHARAMDVWTTEYLQVLEGADPVLEWVKATGLRPVLSGLDDDDRARFLDVYARALRVAYPVRADGRTLYPFRRLFIVAMA